MQPDITRLTTLAAGRPTPTLYMDLDVVAARYRNLQDLLPDVQFYFALKAFDGLPVLQNLAGLGAGFDVGSAAQIKQAQATNVSSDKLLFTNPIKRDIDIETASQAGMSTFATDSDMDLRRIASAIPGAHIIIRLQASNKGSDLPLYGKFGATDRDATQLFETARELGLVPRGVTFHAGSQSHDPSTWAEILQQVKLVFEAAKQEGIELDVIDIGGGFPADYGSDNSEVLAQICEQIIKAKKMFPASVQWIAEPGRYLVANAGIMHTEVIGQREVNGDKWLYIDTGVFQAYIEALQSNYSLHFPIQAIGVQDKNTEFIVAGPSCDASDVIRRDVLLPAKITAGNQLFIEASGAYTTVYGSNFNGFSVPDIQYVQNGEKLNFF